MLSSKEALNSLKSMACIEAGPQNKYITYAKEIEHNEMVEEKYYIIEKDLDRLEKLEKTIELLKTRVKMLETYHEPKSRYYYLYIGGRIVLLSREEYILLKEVLE